MATTKKKSVAKSTKQASATQNMRSFRPYPGEKPFFILRITNQTFYWLIICMLVLALGIWAVVLTIRVQDIYDRVDTQNASDNTVPKMVR